MQNIQNIATVTSKGQITLPKVVRQALDLDVGSQIIFTFTGNSIVINRIEEQEHHDPAIQRFLSVLENDIKQGQHVQTLPASLVASMHSAIIDEDIENLEIDGEVCL